MFCIMGPVLLNWILANYFQGVVLRLLSWAIYSGELMVMAFWLSWGPGNYLTRLSNVLFVGAVWCATGWLDGKQFDGNGRLRSEVLKTPYIAAFSLAGVAVPLVLVRLVLGCRLERSSDDAASSQFSLSQMLKLVFLIAVICASMSAGPDYISAVAYIVMILSPLGLFGGTFVIATLMGKSIRPLILLVPVLPVAAIATFWARVASGMNPSGDMLPNYRLFFFLAGVVMACLASACIAGRAFGYRVTLGK